MWLTFWPRKIEFGRLSSIAIQLLRRLRSRREWIAHWLRSPALKALVCAHLLVAAIIFIRGNGMAGVSLGEHTTTFGA